MLIGRTKEQIVVKPYPGCTSLRRVSFVAVVALLAAISPAMRADEKASPVVPTTEQTTQAITDSAAPRMRLRIAVDQSKWREIQGDWTRLPGDVREGIQALLIEKLQKSGYFQVMEREYGAMQQMGQEDQIDAVKRQSLAEGAAAEGAPAPTTPMRAKRTPARYIITPTVTDFAVTSGKSKGVDVGIFSTKKNKTTTTIRLSIRISDAETSAILDTAVASGMQEVNTKAKGFDLGIVRWGDSKESQDVIGIAVEQAMNMAVKEIVARLSKEPWSAFVALQDEETGRVFVNAGSEAGVTMGQEFNVFKTGKIVRDPETGDIISQGDETKIGRLRVVRVEKNASTCEATEGKTFAARNLVRVP